MSFSRLGLLYEAKDLHMMAYKIQFTGEFKLDDH